MSEIKIPFGAQFSPEQIDLPELLSMIEASAGDRKALKQQVLSRFFASHISADEANRGKLAGNTLIALKTYGLIDEDANLTAIGRILSVIAQDNSKLDEEFARHILLHLNGLIVLRVLMDIRASGEQPNLVSLRLRLGERGVSFPSGGTHYSSMRGWLAKAGLFKGQYDVDEARLEELLGSSIETVDNLAGLSIEQRAYLRAFATFPEEEALSNEIAAHATRLYNVRFNEKALPKMFLPLETIGFLKADKSTGGRGAKPYVVRKTNKFHRELSEPLLTAVEQQTGIQIPFIRKGLAELLVDVASADKHTKGKGLEALALYITRLLDLEFRSWRARAEGAEVDLIVEGARLLFNRWQVQCKNTTVVALDDVAKEVGLAPILLSNVILIVTTGTISAEARRYARAILLRTNLNIVFLTGDDLLEISNNPTTVGNKLEVQARDLMKLRSNSAEV